MFFPVLLAIIGTEQASFLEFKHSEGDCSIENTGGSLRLSCNGTDASCYTRMNLLEAKVDELTSTLADVTSTLADVQSKLTVLIEHLGVPPSPPPLPPNLPPLPPNLPPTPPYCASSTCGSPLAATWSVLTEFGTLSPPRFGDSSRQAYSWEDMLNLGWESVGDAVNMFNYASYLCTACGTNAHISFFASSHESAAYQVAVPVGATQLLIAYGGGDTYHCKCDVTNAGGSVGGAYSDTAGGVAAKADITVAVVDVNTASAPGSIKFTEQGVNVCLLFYILYR
jgi:hypothetical protein